MRDGAAASDVTAVVSALSACRVAESQRKQQALADITAAAAAAAEERQAAADSGDPEQRNATAATSNLTACGRLVHSSTDPYHSHHKQSSLSRSLSEGKAGRAPTQAAHGSSRWGHSASAMTAVHDDIAVDFDGGADWEVDDGRVAGMPPIPNRVILFLYTPGLQPDWFLDYCCLSQPHEPGTVGGVPPRVESDRNQACQGAPGPEVVRAASLIAYVSWLARCIADVYASMMGSAPTTVLSIGLEEAGILVLCHALSTLRHTHKVASANCDRQ